MVDTSCLEKLSKLGHIVNETDGTVTIIVTQSVDRKTFIETSTAMLDAEALGYNVLFAEGE